MLMGAFVAAAAVAPATGLENARIDFGKHKGELMLHLPDTYLSWISKRRKGRYSLWAPLADKILDDRNNGKNGKVNLAPFTLIASAPDAIVDKFTEHSGNGSLHSAAEYGFISPERKECRQDDSDGEMSVQAHEKENVGEEKVSFSFSSMKLDFLREEVEDSIIFCDVEEKQKQLQVEAEKVSEPEVLPMTVDGGISQEGTVEPEKQIELGVSEKQKEVEGKPVTVEEYKWFKLDKHDKQQHLEPATKVQQVEQAQQGLVDSPNEVQSGKNARLENLLASFNMEEESNFHYGEFIRWCGDSKAFDDGKYIHEHVINSSKRHAKYVLNFLVEMYGKWGDFDQARQVFDGIQNKNVFSWNAMLGAYVQSGRARQAMELFQKMDLEGVKPNKLTLFGIIEACTRGMFLSEVRHLHCRIVDNGFGSDSFLITCLINFYGRCGQLPEAMSAFADARDKDTVTWNTAISALSRNKFFDQALRLFEEMKLEGLRPTPHTLMTMLDVSAGLRSLAEGRKIHSEAAGLEKDTIFGTSLVHMYGKCADLTSATSVFRHIFPKDIVCWNAIIAAYLENHRPAEALKFFEQIPAVVKPNGATFVSILQACSMTGAPLGYKRWIHQRISGCRLENDGTVAGALVEMYVQSGEVLEAGRVFQRIWSPKAEAFTAMICATARTGNAGEALALLRRMQLDGHAPGYEAFMNVVFVCGQRGMADDGARQLLVMSVDHGLSTLVKDYDALSDLFASWKVRF